MKKKFSSMWRVAVALVMVMSLNLVMATPVSAATLASVSATPVDATESVETTYTIGFTTATTWGVETVDIAFTGSFTGTVTDVEVTGIGAGAFLSVGDEDDLPSLTYTVTDPELIDAGTPITITFSSVTNPAAATYEVAVTTKDGTGAVIDTGTVDVIITPLPADFEVVAGTNDTVIAGVAFSVEITALKADSTTETGYTGDHMIDFTGTPGTGTTPGFEVISFTNGVGTSLPNFIWTVAGESGKDITATDESAVAGTSGTITINPATLADFTSTGGETGRTAGDAFSTGVTVTAEDADGNTVEDYTGTVTWTSTDPTATAGAGLPADYTFIAGDLGVKVFAAADFILKTVLFDESDSRIDTTITVTDGTVSLTIPTINVSPAAASEIQVTAAPTSIRADGTNASTITATAYDQFGNVDTSYTQVVTFTKSLGTLTSVDSNFGSTTAGKATVTLTSTEVGTATILVDTGGLPDETVTVTLVPDDLLAEVWVDTVTGDDANAGIASSPVKTIQKGIDIAAEGGTVNVAAGTYTLSTEITIGKQLTLKGANYGVNAVTGDRGAESVIDGFALTSPTNQKPVHITAANVILDGFVIVGPDEVNSYTVFLEVPSTAPGGEVRNNIIYTTGNFAILTESSSHSSWVISNNRVSAVGNGTPGTTTAVYLGGGEGAEVNGNLITSGGITLTNDVANTTIENNTLSNDMGRGVSIAADADGVTITGNTFSGNKEAGVEIWAGATKVSTYAIHQNNFAYHLSDKNGVENGTSTQVYATNNWWGDGTGPTHTSNPDGYGEGVGDLVGFTPWLLAPYTAPVDPVAPVTSIELYAGWNLVSLPLIPTDADIDTVLTGVMVDSVWNYTAATTTWSNYVPLAPDDLVTMVDGKGYWVEMSAAETLTIQGVELPDPPFTPPTYDVVVGWNFIGFKSTTAKTANTYLAALDGQYTVIYAFDAVNQAYVTVLSSDNFEPGKGYWIAITAAGTIYP